MDIVKRKAKLIEISPLAGQKKTKAKVLLNNFPVVYLDYGQEKLTEIKKKISMRENKKWAVPAVWSYH